MVVINLISLLSLPSTAKDLSVNVSETGIGSSARTTLGT